MRARSWLAVILAAAIALPALAQPTTLRIRGQVTAHDGQVLVVSTREGESARITLAPNYQVFEVVPVDPAALEAGRDVGVVGERQADNRVRALAVLLYPRGARGTTEGHFPWDLTPQSTMTNATITATVASQDDRELTVTYRSGQARVVIPPGVPVVTYRPVGRSALHAGVNVFLTGAQFPDSTLTAARVLVGQGGMIPPM